MFFPLNPFIPLFLFSCIFAGEVVAQPEKNGTEAVLNYVNHRLVKGGTGYGWEDQPDGHLTPTYAAIGILYHLDALPADISTLIEFVRTHHPQRNPENPEAGPSGAEIRNLVYQQVQSLVWLGDDVSDFRAEVEKWGSQQGHWANFERDGLPPLMQEVMTPILRGLLEMQQDETIVAYLNDRRRVNGSFNNAPVADGGDGNILNTWWGLYVLSFLNEHIELADETAEWIQACQTGNGGFTHQPDPVIGVNDEVVYSWAGTKALHLLGTEPEDKKGAIRYLLSLQNSDGGFGNRPGLPSTPMASFYAIDALQTLGALAELESNKIRGRSISDEVPDFSGYNIYTVQFQAPGAGSPYEAVMLADSLNIDLWGAKNADAEWIVAAQNLADQTGVHVTLFHSNEDYGKHVDVDGMGSFNHVFDPIFPVERQYQSQRWSLRKQYVFTWEEFAEEYVQPLFNDNGALLWQVNYNEPLARLLLDHSVNEGKYYVAVSTVHFDQNFLFWNPFLYQYRHQLPFIALQDFHGSESWWWANELVHYRNLFLAKEPTYEAMMQALRENRIVTVRHDELTGHRPRVLGGAPGVQEAILLRKDEWKWWDEDSGELNHPWAAVTVLKPGDEFEEGSPETGVNIRIRCWWKGPGETLSEPVVDLVRMMVNSVDVRPEYVEQTNPQERFSDAYYLFAWPDVEPGEHQIEVTLKRLDDGVERVMEILFVYD